MCDPVPQSTKLVDTIVSVSEDSKGVCAVPLPGKVDAIASPEVIPKTDFCTGKKDPSEIKNGHLVRVFKSVVSVDTKCRWNELVVKGNCKSESVPPIWGEMEALQSGPYGDRVLAQKRVWQLASKIQLTDFMRPAGVVVDDKQKEIYISDLMLHRVVVLNVEDGSFVRFIGNWASSQLCVSSSDDGAFDRPWGLALDSKRREIYVAENGNRRIQIFRSASGKLLRRIGGPDPEGKTVSELRGLRGLCLDGIPLKDFI